MISAFKFQTNEAGIGKVAVALAAELQESRFVARDYSQVFGLDPRWIEQVMPQRFNLEEPTVLCWLESGAVMQAAGRVARPGEPCLWRFHIPKGRWVRHPTFPGLSVTDVIAIVGGELRGVPMTSEDARVALVKWTRAQPEEHRERMARVAECAPDPMPLALTPGLIAWGETA